MSYYFISMISRSTKNIKRKINIYKTEFKIYEEEKLIKQKYKNYQSNFGTKDQTPNHIKMNPFYWTFLFKSFMMKNMGFLFEKYKDKPKQINSENQHNYPTIKQVNNKLVEFTKKTSIVIINAVNSLIVKITFGYVDLLKISNKNVILSIKNIPSAISKRINYQIILNLYNKMGNQFGNLRRTSSHFLDKYKDPKKYEEFKNYYQDYLRKMETQTGDKNSKYNQYKQYFNFKKFLPSSLYQIRSMYENKIHKVNRFIKSPTYMQQFYNTQLRFRKFWGNKKKFFQYSFYSENFNSKSLSKFVDRIRVTNYMDYFRYGWRKLIYKIIFYMALYLAIVYSFKYLWFKLTNKNHDSNLKEALKAVNDLKHQNEELIQHNRELMNRILDDRKRN